VQTDRIMANARDLLDDAELAPYLIFYLQGGTKDDPQVRRTDVMDFLGLPDKLNSGKFDPQARWEMAESVFNFVVDPAKEDYLRTELEGFITRSVPLERKPPKRHKGIIPLYFPSGSNHAGEIRGWEKSGMNMGIATPEVYGKAKKRKEAQQALKATRKAKVFIDSGAFEEVTFDKGYPEDKKPITDVEWRKRLAFYEDMGYALGNRAYLVTPDKIADQRETLRRLDRYMPVLYPMLDSFPKAKRPHLIAPIQKGEMSMIEFDRAVREFLGDDFIRGIPMKKDATSVKELEQFVKALYRDKTVPKPIKLHLLGKGRVSGKPNWENHIRPLLEKIDPKMKVSLDSVRIRAIAGRGGTKYASPIRDRIRKQVDVEYEQAWDEAYSDVTDPRRLKVYRKLHGEAKEYDYEERLAKGLDRLRKPFTRSRDETLGAIIATSLMGGDRIELHGKKYTIPSLAKEFKRPSSWLNRSRQADTLQQLSVAYPTKGSFTHCLLSPHSYSEFQLTGGMTPQRTAQFRKDPTAFLKPLLEMEEGRYIYGDVLQFLYGENFFGGVFEQDPTDADYAFLSAEDGVLTRHFVAYVENHLVRDIKEASLSRLTPTQKGISIQNNSRYQMRKRRNPIYGSTLVEDGIQLCDDYDTDTDCIVGDPRSELYHSATAYKKAWQKAMKAKKGKKSFPLYEPTQILYDGLGRQYLSEYRVFRTNDDGSGAVIPSNEPGSFWTIKSYPPALQARDLATKGEKLKIQAMATNLDPIRLLTHHADATLGAPVVWEAKKGKFFVLAGNGRTIALLMAPKGKFAEYEELGKEMWGGLWPRGKDPKGKRSILVRVIRHVDGKNLTQRQAVQFAGGSQVSTSGAETPIREALSYMRALGVDQDKLPAFEWYGEVNADNAERFYNQNRAFVNEIISQLSPAQRARITNDAVVFAKTISMALAGFLPMEVVNEGFASVGEEEALLAMLPALVFLQDLIDDGKIKKGWDLLPHLLEAKDFLQVVKRKSYQKSIDWIIEDLPMQRRQTGLLAGGSTGNLAEKLTPLGIGLGLFLKKSVQAADPASKSTALKKYIEDGVAANQKNMFGQPMLQITPIESLAEQLLGKQLGKNFEDAIMKTFGKKNPRRRRNTFVPTEAYTGKIAKGLQKYKKGWGLKKLSQNYKGTGTQKANRQLELWGAKGGLNILWLMDDGYRMDMSGNSAYSRCVSDEERKKLMKEYGMDTWTPGRRGQIQWEGDYDTDLQNIVDLVSASCWGHPKGMAKSKRDKIIVSEGEESVEGLGADGRLKSFGVYMLSDDIFIGKVIDKGFTKKESEKIFRAYKKEKIIKKDPKTHSWKVKHGEFWEKEVLDNVLSCGLQAASSITILPKSKPTPLIDPDYLEEGTLGSDPQFVGKTILKQMGGTGKLKAMIGAKTFTTYQDARDSKYGEGLGGVSFKFPKPGGTNKPNFVKIILDPNDTYTMTLGAIRGTMGTWVSSYKIIDTISGLYADQLRPIFEDRTGLYLTLGEVRQAPPLKLTPSPKPTLTYDQAMKKAYDLGFKAGEEWVETGDGMVAPADDPVLVKFGRNQKVAPLINLMNEWIRGKKELLRSDAILTEPSKGYDLSEPPKAKSEAKSTPSLQGWHGNLKEQKDRLLKKARRVFGVKGAQITGSQNTGYRLTINVYLKDWTKLGFKPGKQALSAPTIHELSEKYASQMVGFWKKAKEAMKKQAEEKKAGTLPAYAQKLLDTGLFNEWKKKGRYGLMHRLYVKKVKDFLIDALNIDVGYYGTGNLSSFSLDGDQWSNTRGRGFMTDLAESKIFYNVENRKWKFDLKFDLQPYESRIEKALFDHIETGEGVGRKVAPSKPPAKPPAKKQYAYGLQHRPAGMGATPKGHTGFGEDKIKRRATRHGIIHYDRPLTEKEIYDYQLVPIVPKHQIVNMIMNVVDYKPQQGQFGQKAGAERLANRLQSMLQGRLKPYSIAPDVTRDEIFMMVAEKLIKLADKTEKDPLKQIAAEVKQATPQERKELIKDLKEGEKIVTAQVVKAVQKEVKKKTGATVTQKEAAEIAVIEFDLQQDKMIVQAKKAEIKSKAKQKKKAAQVIKLKQDVDRIEKRMEKKIEKAHKIVKERPAGKKKWTKPVRYHHVVQGDDLVEVKTEHAKNVWGIYIDEDDYAMITHMPSGFDVFEAEDFRDAVDVHEILHKNYKNWFSDLELGTKPPTKDVTEIREFLKGVS
jgi:hypothetical protein